MCRSPATFGGPGRAAPLVLVAAAAALVTASCRAPRDPALDRRIAAARAEKGSSEPSGREGEGGGGGRAVRRSAGSGGGARSASAGSGGSAGSASAGSGGSASAGSAGSASAGSGGSASAGSAGSASAGSGSGGGGSGSPGGSGSAQGAEGKPGPPPKGIQELRSYDDETVDGLLAEVPGDGEELRAVLETGEGTIHCTLAPDAAPQTVANFVALVRGLRAWRDPDTSEVHRSRFYDGLTFHRCIGDFIIQTGNPGTEADGGPGWRIPREEGIQGAYEEPGVLGMVDAGSDNHGSQFFITLRAAPNLADTYTPFGTCEDRDVVRTIANAPKLPAEEEGETPTQPKSPVSLEKVTVRRR